MMSVPYRFRCTSILSSCFDYQQTTPRSSWIAHRKCVCKLTKCMISITKQTAITCIYSQNTHTTKFMNRFYSLTSWRCWAVSSFTNQQTYQMLFVLRINFILCKAVCVLWVCGDCSYSENLWKLMAWCISKV